MNNFESWSLYEANPTVQRWKIRALLAVGYHPPNSATCIILKTPWLNLGSVWFMANFATTKLRQSVSATKNVANKMATTSVARFGKKVSL